MAIWISMFDRITLLMIGRYGNRICSFEENAYLIKTKYLKLCHWILDLLKTKKDVADLHPFLRRKSVKDR